jgi:hypothetical protein
VTAQLKIDSLVIDLTIHDIEEVSEQSALVLGCATAVQVLLDKVHMNSRGSVKRIMKERPPSLLAEMESKQEKTVSAGRRREETAR